MAIEWRTVVDRTTNGHAIKVTVGAYLGMAEAVSRIDGVEDVMRGSLHRAIPAAVRDKGYVASLGRVALTAAEAEAIEAALAAVRAELASDPAAQRARLRTERAGLVNDLRAALDAERDDQDAAWEREDERRAVVTPVAVAAGIEAARAAIRQFDAAHPDVKAEIEADERAVVERHIWD